MSYQRMDDQFAESEGERNARLREKRLSKRQIRAAHDQQAEAIARTDADAKQKAFDSAPDLGQSRKT